MRDLAALLLGLTLAACSNTHTISGGHAGRGGRGGGGAYTRPDSGPNEDDAAEPDADSGGMSGGGDRQTGAGSSGGGGMPIVDRGSTAGVGGVRQQPGLAAAMLHSTPGRTDCGTIDCESYPRMPHNEVGEPYCCATSTSFCSSANLGPCESGVPYYCDEAADCEQGLRCCTDTLRTMWTCRADCSHLVQICKTDAECENGETCTVYDCGRKQFRGVCGSKEPPWWGCSPL